MWDGSPWTEGGGARDARAASADCSALR